VCCSRCHAGPLCRRLKHARGRQHLGAWFTGPDGGALAGGDEPERVQQLRKMLALFLGSPDGHASAGRSLDC
jgi:hypothetical protein